MSQIPAHAVPTATTEALEDALFHYTTAGGLKGIFESRALWSTAYYCANDESELSVGEGVLENMFRQVTYELMRDRDPRIVTIAERGLDPLEVPDRFERLVLSLTFNIVCAYISCFCRPRADEDFHHGLLSQWRAYGLDGGYAVQFSRGRLIAALEGISDEEDVRYDLNDVHYARENPLKKEVERYRDSFMAAYLDHLDMSAKPLNELIGTKDVESPIARLTGGPLESLVDYLVQTKNKHFEEEMECRLSLVQPVGSGGGRLPVKFYNRSGLLVPYTVTPEKLDVVGCIEWIVVGPGPRLKARMESVRHLIKESGREIGVRPSHIPFTRL